MPATGFEGWHADPRAFGVSWLRVIMPATGFEGWHLCEQNIAAELVQ